MFDVSSESCKSCVVAIEFMKVRISQEELDFNCKRRCRYRMTKHEDINQPDLFSMAFKASVCLALPRLTVIPSHNK